MPIQASALNASTNIVTMTIGGNDAGFSPVIQLCVATLSKNIADKVARHPESTFKTVKKVAPNAQIFVVGYPSLFPDAASTPAAGCFT
jgi:hypothetical protein